MARQFDPRTCDIYEKLGKVHSHQPKVARKKKAQSYSSKTDSLDDQFKNIIKLDMRATVSTFAQSSLTSPRPFEKLPGVSSAKFQSHTSSLSPTRLPPAYRVSATHNRSLMLDMVESGGFAEKPRKHVRSPVRFDRQAARGELKLSDYDASENRFVTINHSPSNSTKVQRATAPNLEKYLGRTDTTKKDNLPNYDAKYDFVYKGVKQTPGFEKRVGRDNIFTVPLNDLSYDGKHELVSPRILSPRLDKNLSRPEDKVLPAFMLKVGFRLGLNLNTEKSLEMNSYCESEFLDKPSIFGKLEPLPPKNPETKKGKRTYQMLLEELKAREKLN